MPNANFTLKLTRDEANDVAMALKAALDKLTSLPVAELTDGQRNMAGRIEMLLRRDF